MNGRYHDLLIITEDKTEADAINALGNETVFAIPYGSSLFHGRRYRRIVKAYIEREDKAYEYASMLGLRSGG